MGKQKYRNDIERLLKSPVVTATSVRLIVKKNYTKQLIQNLLKQGKIMRITKGYYTTRNTNSLAVLCFKPAYLGLQDALSFHNLWEQETIPVVITPRKIRQGLRSILGGNVLFRRLSQKYFFGFTYYKEGDVYLPYSDVEKTFIDMVYFCELISDEAFATMKKKIDRKRLVNYLKAYPLRFRTKVMGLFGLLQN